MQKTAQPSTTKKKCELCEQTMNPTIHIYKERTCLCKACFGHMQQLPETLAKCVERFLMGNAV
jgi:hypothetical protein